MRPSSGSIAEVGSSPWRKARRRKWTPCTKADTRSEGGGGGSRAPFNTSAPLGWVIPHHPPTPLDPPTHHQPPNLERLGHIFFRTFGQSKNFPDCLAFGAN